MKTPPLYLPRGLRGKPGDAYSSVDPSYTETKSFSTVYSGSNPLNPELLRARDAVEMRSVRLTLLSYDEYQRRLPETALPDFMFSADVIERLDD